MQQVKKLLHLLTEQGRECHDGDLQAVGLAPLGSWLQLAVAEQDRRGLLQGRKL